MDQLAIRLFGRLEVSYAGSDQQFRPPPRARPLLGYIVLNAGQAIGRSTLAALFWPDESDEDARSNLRRHLHQIVRALPVPPGEPWIVATAATISWPLRDDVWVDAHEFERLADDPDQQAAAVECYRGDLLEDYHEEWLLAKRERLRAQFLGMCYDLALSARRDREFEEALRYVDRILATDEWREDAVRLAMAIRYESGDRTGALAVYAAFAKRLRDEMDVTPMPETVALRDSLVTNDVAAPPGPGAAERAVGFKTPFVGRVTETEALNAAWARAARGSGSTIFISGEAGVGKSRLVGELAASVAAEGGRVLFGDTSNPEEVPYEALVEALRRSLPLLIDTRIDRVALSRVAQLLPELSAALPDLIKPETREPAEARRELFEAIARTIEQLSRTRPVVLLVEDLQWANAGTIDALEVLARRAGALPVLIVVTYRSDEVGPGHALGALRRRLQGERRATSIALRALAAPEIAELVRRSVTGVETPPALADAIYGFSEGNPLFANQLLRGYAESGDVPDESTAVRTIAEAVLSRIGALDENARSLAEAGATAGRSFTTELVRRVLGWREDEVVDALAPLLDRAIVREAGGAAYGYTFTHALIAGAIYEATPLPRRAARHRRIAQVMTEQRGDDRTALATIARHWREAGDNERAAPLYFEAAERAAAVYAYDESVEYGTQAALLATEDRVVRAALLLRESVHAIQGLREEQHRDLAALEELREQDPDGEFAWGVLRRRVLLARGTDDLQSEVACLGRLQEQATASGRPDWLAESQKLFSDYYFARSEVALAEESAREALALFADLGDEAAEVYVLCLLSRIEADRGDLVKMRSYLEQARALLGAHDINAIMNALSTAAYSANYRQDFRATVDLASQSLELAREGGNKARMSDALNWMGIAKTRLGDFGAARRDLVAAREMFVLLGRPHGAASALLNLGILEWRIGELEIAHALVSEASQALHDVHNGRGEVLAATNLSNICTRLGRYDEGIAHAESALRMSRESNLRAYENGAMYALGFAKHRSGDVAAGIAFTEDALSRSREVERPVDILEALSELSLAYATIGKKKKALAFIEELLSSSSVDIESAFWPHLYPWVAAQVYRLCGEPEKSARALAAAVDAADRLQASICATEDGSAFATLPLNVALRLASAKDDWPETVS
jgi:predicted ATPase/DNA-binding SARP family transcriptional activator